ncbi:MAG: hypothetical protein ABF868_00400 [Sporolactobacillus sp.]
MKKEHPEQVRFFSGIGCVTGLLASGLLFLTFQWHDRYWIYQRAASSFWSVIAAALVLCIAAGTGVGWLAARSHGEPRKARRHAWQSFGLCAGVLLGTTALFLGSGYGMAVAVVAAGAVAGAMIGARSARERR